MIANMTAPLTCAADGLARRGFTVAEVERVVEVGLIPHNERLEILGREILAGRTGAYLSQNR